MEELAYYVRLCVKNEAAKQDLDQFFRERQQDDEKMTRRFSRLYGAVAWLVALLRRPLKKTVHIL